MKGVLMRKYIRYGLFSLAGAVGFSAILEMLAVALNSLLLLAAISLIIYYSWDYLNDQSSNQPA